MPINKYIKLGEKNPFFGKTHSVETKKKISEAKKEYYRTHSAYWQDKKRSEETRKKISLANKGRISPQKGTHHTLDQRIKSSEQRLREKSPFWKGGRAKNRGYVGIISPFHSPGIKASYRLEHRLVVERYLGRSLLRTEPVHHVNGIRNDNQKENLIAFNSMSAHRRFGSNKEVSPAEIIFDGRLA